MRIKVEIDVPDGEQCGDCKHWLNPVKNVSCYCPVFREFLRGWSRATSMKCDQCLSAKEVTK
jgi:hypothetical protein